MNRFPTTVLVVTAAVVAIIGGWLLFAQSERARYAAVRQVRDQRSEIRFSITVQHERGAIASEEWQFANLDGRASATYTATDRRGTRATFAENEPGQTVSFLFDRLVADGIWELQTRPYRGPDPNVHIVRIAQTAGVQSGSHAFSFSDAHYLATTAGREYHLHLDRDKPVPDLLRLDSTSSADPRYQKILDDFRSFGSARFRTTVAEARRKLLQS